MLEKLRHDHTAYKSPRVKRGRAPRVRSGQGDDIRNRRKGVLGDGGAGVEEVTSTCLRLARTGAGH
jgi:hypothetical protein